MPSRRLLAVGGKRTVGPRGPTRDALPRPPPDAPSDTRGPLTACTQGRMAERRGFTSSSRRRRKSWRAGSRRSASVSAGCRFAGVRWRSEPRQQRGEAAGGSARRVSHGGVEPREIRARPRRRSGRISLTAARALERLPKPARASACSADGSQPLARAGHGGRRSNPHPGPTCPTESNTSGGDVHGGRAVHHDVAFEGLGQSIRG